MTVVVARSRIEVPPVQRFDNLLKLNPAIAAGIPAACHGLGISPVNGMPMRTVTAGTSEGKLRRSDEAYKAHGQRERDDGDDENENSRECGKCRSRILTKRARAVPSAPTAGRSGPYATSDAIA